MDWNWFFSSLAQSTAAIVGIFGAFIITKILSNQATFDGKISQIRDLSTKSNSLRDEASDLSIAWYNGKIASCRIDDIKSAFDSNPNVTAESLFEELNFSIYQSEDDALRFIEEKLDSLKSQKEREAAAAREQTGIIGDSFLSVRPVTLPNITPVFEIESVKAERVRMDSALRNCKQHIRVVRDILKSIEHNPEHSGQISYVLWMVLALFFAGVIYPLSLTPAPSGSLVLPTFAGVLHDLVSMKGLLLSLVSIIFTAIVGMFFFMNIKMKYSEAIRDSLTQYSSLSYYSNYFEIAALNKAKNE